MKFLRVLCVLCGLLVQARAIDREAFTFTNYDLDVRIEPEQQRLAVRGKIIFAERLGSASEKSALANFLQPGLEIDPARRQAGSSSSPSLILSDIDHTGALSEAIVTLPQAIPPKGTVELEIGYEGIDSS